MEFSLIISVSLYKEMLVKKRVFPLFLIRKENYGNFKKQVRLRQTGEPQFCA